MVQHQKALETHLLMTQYDLLTLHHRDKYFIITNLFKILVNSKSGSTTPIIN